MEPEEFVRFRLWLGKTQAGISQLLGVSVRAVCAYEGGWRTIPPHVQRQVMFLGWKRLGRDAPHGPCWKVMGCPGECRDGCPAWEFRVGDLCWFINGTHCHGAVQTTWVEKMNLCRKCKMLKPLLKELGSAVPKGSHDRHCGASGKRAKASRRGGRGGARRC
ncbi:MAG: transcriptional regulator [Deltaproteobacteria bacterium]|nr:transcriptional regulator [Deltaproteobacteria bacterium]MBW2537181.1 transcriptional regulator [Deltaproteobacteria bacterium]